MGDFFPINEKKISFIEKEDGSLALFLSITCQSCIEILGQIKDIKDDWKQVSLIIYLFGNEKEIESLKKKMDAEILVILYKKEDMRFLNTEFFPFVYYISKEREILSKGTINSKEDIHKIISKAS
ncbi:hypothetical protein MHI32_09520 [Paenibacillus sp. FSL H7-0690]|uniref:hypothetical protein n=1 Tax=Paenibacillus sp. FSL H7-0690 TaxID=2921437 RepID=UPI0030EF1349